MDKTLPKGHVSCLSSAFRYTAASNTDIAKTFARIRHQVGRHVPEAAQNIRVLQPRRLGGRATN